MRNTTRITLATSLILLLAALALVLSGCGRDSWAAKVNGEKISNSEVNRHLDELERKSPDIFDGADGEGRRIDYREQIVNALIDQVIVAQKAKEMKVRASASEIDSQIDAMRGEMTNAQWEEALEASGYTEDMVHDNVESQILTSKLVAQEQAAKPIDKSDIASYYEYNKVQFKIEGKKDKYLSLEEATPQIIEMLEAQRVSDLYQDMIAKWRKDAKIEVGQVSEETFQ